MVKFHPSCAQAVGFLVSNVLIDKSRVANLSDDRQTRARGYDRSHIPLEGSLRLAQGTVQCLLGV